LPAFQAPATEDFALRLQLLLRWLAKATGYEQAFVSDHEGLALVQSDASEELIAAAASVGSGWRAASGHLSLPQARSFSVDLEDDLCLHLFAEPSTWGQLTLGFATSRSITGKTREAVASAFRHCLKERIERKLNHDA
jgi:hypothetical protein